MTSRCTRWGARTSQSATRCSRKRSMTMKCSVTPVSSPRRTVRRPLWLRLLEDHRAGLLRHSDRQAPGSRKPQHRGRRRGKDRRRCHQGLRPCVKSNLYSKKAPCLGTELFIGKNQLALLCSLSGRRFVMLLRPMASVDMLCSSAEVVGGRIPSTPSTMSEKLKPTMKR